MFTIAHMGVPFDFAVVNDILVFLAMYLKIACISKTAGRRVKRSTMWGSRVLVEHSGQYYFRLIQLVHCFKMAGTHMWGILDFVGLKVCFRVIRSMHL